MSNLIDDPDFLDLIAAWHENSELPPERRGQLLERLTGDAELRRELAQEIQMAGLTRTIQAGEPRWLRLEEKLEVMAPPDPKETEDAVMKTITRQLKKGTKPRLWTRQLTALAAGVVAGLFGAGLVWASIGSPTATARVVSLEHGDFEALPGPLAARFPVLFGEWSGDPAEVVEWPDGGRVLRFVETAGEPNLPNSPATSCDVFQLVDLRTLRQQAPAGNVEGELIIELLARFGRSSSPGNERRPTQGVCNLYLFNAAPDSLGQDWPMVLREAVAMGAKRVELKPGQPWVTASAACILPPEATVAVIHLGAALTEQVFEPVAQGECFADDVKLTLTRRPKLPIRIVN